MLSAAEPPGEAAAIVSAGNLRVDVAMYCAFVADQPVALTYQEFDLLRLLVAGRDRIIPYDELIAGIWRGEKPGTRRQLGVAVCRLRAKIAAARPYRILTVRGRGYGLTVVEQPVGTE